MPEPAKTFLGHPRGLATLFFTEMWERFSYYGMRALLLLFMLEAVDKGGMGLEEKTAGAIYGLYTMFVYLLALPGGWLADKFFGLRKSVFYGGCIITLGHLCLAIPRHETFFVGLMFVVIGTGLLKPNISSLVGELYSKDDQARRDAGFSIFYMGINIGATISPIITSYLGEQVNWHYGFAAAGIGMAFGVIQYKLQSHTLGDAGLLPEILPDTEQQRKRSRNIRLTLISLGVLLFLLIAGAMAGIIIINPVKIAMASTYLLVGGAVLFFAYILFFEGLNTEEKKKIAVIAVFFAASATFYAGYEQQGSTLNLFADRYTQRMIGAFEIPAGWFQTVPAGASMIFALVFAWLWVWLAKRKMNPSTPVKFSMGLLFLSLGYVTMMAASMVVIGGRMASPGWLVTTYCFHTFGEICLYVVGLSSVTKLSPKRLVGQMMGMWFMSLAFGNLIAGLFSGEFDDQAIAANPQLLVDLFWVVAKVLIVAGVVMLVISKPLRKWMGNIK